MESLAEAREAAAAGELARALDLIDGGLAALGRHYQRHNLIDDTGMQLSLAASLRGRGDLAGAYEMVWRVLEDRIALYEGRSGEAC